MRVISGTILLSFVTYLHAINYENLNTLSVPEIEQLTLEVNFTFSLPLSLFLSLSLVDSSDLLIGYTFLNSSSLWLSL